MGLSVNGGHLGVIGRDGGIRGLERIGNGRGLSGGRVFGGDNFALFDHGVDDTIGNTLVSEINDVLWTQGVDRARITDVIDHNIVANLGAAKFEDVFDAVRELGRCDCGLGGGISGCRDGDWRGGGGGVGIRGQSNGERKASEGDGEGSQTRREICCFHNYISYDWQTSPFILFLFTVVSIFEASELRALTMPTDRLNHSCRCKFLSDN